MKHRYDGVKRLIIVSKKPETNVQNQQKNCYNSTMNDMVINFNMDMKSLDAKLWKKCNHADI